MSESCFVWAAPSLVLAWTYFSIALFSWVSVGDRLRLVLKLAKEVQSCTRAEIIKYWNLKYLCHCKKYWYSIQWSSGNTGPVRWNSQWIESLSDRSILLKSAFIISLEYAEGRHVSFVKIFFYRVFFTSKFTRKIYRVSRKISYNRNPVNSNRSSNSTNLLIHMASLHSIVAMASLMLVYIRALFEVWI
jgi:hypothetical protein